MRQQPMTIVIASLALLLALACSSSDGDDNGDNGDNGENGEAATPVGSWLGVLETDIPGPDDVPFDTLVLDVEENTVAAFMYSETVQVTGWLGEYEHDQEAGEIHITIDRIWREEVSDYVDLDEPFVLPQPFSYTAATLSGFAPDGTPLELDRAAFENPAALVGEWRLEFGDDFMQITAEAAGAYEFEQGGPSIGEHTESGEWRATGETEGYLRTVPEVVNGVPVTVEALTRYEIITDGDDTFFRLFWPMDGEETAFDFQYQ